MQIDKRGRHQRDEAERFAAASDSGYSAPRSRSHQRDNNDQTEERLRQTGMKDSDFIFQHRDAQTAQNTLQNDGSNRGDSEHTDPTARVYQPKPHGKDNGEKSDS